VAGAALARYEVRPRRLRLITNEFNAVFRVDADDGSRFMLRVNLPRRRTLDEVRAELAWMQALAADSAVAVPSPVATPGGELVVVAGAPGVPEPRHCVLLRWVDGRKLTQRLSSQNLAVLGETTARLHEHALGWSPPPGLRAWDNPFPLDDHAEHLVDVDARDRSTFARAAVLIEDVLVRLSREPARMIHNDLHQDNVLVTKDGLVVIDFDDALLGHPVQDIGVTFWNLREEPAFASLKDAFRRGYERVAPWPEIVPGDIDAFIADRSLMLIDYSLRDTDPQERATLPAFIRQEVAHLRRWIDPYG
jgi:Ser/Thr protein kinase RdoA (MazF antagonist)